MANQKKKNQKVVKTAKATVPAKEEQLTFEQVSKEQPAAKSTNAKTASNKPAATKPAAKQPLTPKEEKAQIELDKKIAELERQAAQTTAGAAKKKQAAPQKPDVKEKIEEATRPIDIPPTPAKNTNIYAQSSEELLPLKENKSSSSKKKNKGKKGYHEDRKLRLAVGKGVPFAYSEAYKSLRTNLNFIASTEDIKSIVVTSAIPKESKSNVAVNLAMTLATEGKKVILVDCDFRQPALNHYLKLGRHHKGFTDVLIGRVELKDAITTFKDAKISVLTAGSIPPNPSEMLAQKKTKSIIDALKENFDYVIIDAPPVTVVTDAAILSTYVDGVVFVVRSKYAPIETLQLAKKKLDDVNARILGVVLTRFNAKSTTKSSAYTYAYGYGYGDGYGRKDD